MHIFFTIQLSQSYTLSNARTNTVPHFISKLVTNNGRSVSYSMNCLILAYSPSILHSCSIPTQYNFPTKFCSLRFPYSKLPVPYDSSEIAICTHLTNIPCYIPISSIRHLQVWHQVKALQTCRLSLPLHSQVENHHSRLQVVQQMFLLHNLLHGQL